MINDTYYKGFEGEPEIQFICKKTECDEVLVIWEGYFDEIMKRIAPQKDGWTGLAYYYNMCLGWYEESPWVVDDLHMSLEQFCKIEKYDLSKEAKEVLGEICGMLKEAIENDLVVLIGRG